MPAICSRGGRGISFNLDDGINAISNKQINHIAKQLPRRNPCSSHRQPCFSPYFTPLNRPIMKVCFASSSLLVLAAIPIGVNAFHVRISRAISPTGLFMSEGKELETTDNPCWQDVYGDGDDDCGMSTVYSSTFVAEKWIKSMPCGHDLDVSSFCSRLRVVRRECMLPKARISDTSRSAAMRGGAMISEAAVSRWPTLSFLSF